MGKVKALVITGFGLNCEKETTAAFEYVGAEVSMVHLNDLISGARSLKEFQILAFIGGFSFGDHLGSGTVFANRVNFRLHDELKEFIAAGKLIIGICNGFQTLTRLGMVPALDGNYFEQKVALAHNDSGVFRDDWCRLKANPASPCSKHLLHPATAQLCNNHPLRLPHLSEGSCISTIKKMVR